MQTFYKICLILMIIGGINWGLVGLFQFDFVGWLLGGSSSIWQKRLLAKKRPLAREPFFLCHFILLPSRQDRAG